MSTYQPIIQGYRFRKENELYNMPTEKKLLHAENGLQEGNSLFMAKQYGDAEYKYEFVYIMIGAYICVLYVP